MVSGAGRPALRARRVLLGAVHPCAAWKSKRLGADPWPTQPCAGIVALDSEKCGEGKAQLITITALHQARALRGAPRQRRHGLRAFLIHRLRCNYLKPLKG